MASIRKQDKLGAFSGSGSAISLAASTFSIGGQQYITTAALTGTLSGLSVNTLYHVYAVLSNGAPSLVTSTNVNSVGPSGFTAWKLVGAFYSNATSTFGSAYPIDRVDDYSSYRLRGVSGFGSTSTRILLFNGTTDDNTGDAFSVSNGATTGTIITVLKTGVYDLSAFFVCGNSASDSQNGVSILKNPSAGDITAVDYTTLTGANLIASSGGRVAGGAGYNYMANPSCSVRLSAGDNVRLHVGQNLSDTLPNTCAFQLVYHGKAFQSPLINL